MSDTERRIRECLERLPAAQREQLLDFAEFLLERHGERPGALPEPEPIPRPEDESVMAAIKRLSSSYHMLDRGKMLHETSALMAQHVMQGREAGEVIDELEMVFLRHYERLVDDSSE